MVDINGINFTEREIDLYINELIEFISIPSVSADPDYKPYLMKAASWLKKRLTTMGADNICVHDYRGIPMLTANLFCGKPDAPTILLYGHYDVQPPGPESNWESPPFQAERRCENLYGRGATDMKGQIIALFAALDHCIANQTSAWNFRFLFEGCEEFDGSLLEGFILENRKILECDLVLNVDAGMVGPESPSIVYGSRGIAGGKLIISGPSKDLHCGEFGGVVLNPVHVLCSIIAGLHDREGRVTLPGFYDALASYENEERALMAKLPMNEDFFLRETGVKQLWGEPGYTPLERSILRPILEVVDLEVPGMSSSISPEASALLFFRLVPNQDPEQIKKLMEKYLHDTVPEAVNWRMERWSGCKASVSDPFSPAANGLKDALKSVWLTEPLLTRTGGSLPMVEFFHQGLGVEVLLTGFQLPEDNMHGPNEKIHIPTWEKGCQALQIFFQSHFTINKDL